MAGPIPGVGISAPDLGQPAIGQRIRLDQQPVTLIVQNASTTGVRPLSYLFEVAADAGFTNMVFSRESVTPGEDGRTSVRLPEPLATGRTYYWRVRAEDGANTGPYSAVANFVVFTPVVLDAPALVSPVGDVQIDSVTPRFVLSNAPRSGPAGEISYLMELSESPAFGNVLAAWVFHEQPNQSQLQAPVGLGYGKTYFWRARAQEDSGSGPWSAPASFKSPAPPQLPPPPPPGGGGGGGGGKCSAPVAADGIDMNAAGIYNSPTDLAKWCITAKVTSVTFRSSGFGVDFTKREGGNRWPDFVTPGWSGPLQYTLGMCLNVNGQWACSAVVEFWYGRDIFDTAAPSHIALEWFYDPRWGPLFGRQPADGETVGLFVCAGDCRNTTEAVNPNLKERSNVAMVKWSNSGGPAYSF